MMKFIFFLFFMILFFNWLVWYVLVFILSLFIFMFFYFMYFSSFFSNMCYGFGGDVLSLSLIVLSIWIIILMLLSSFYIYNTSFFIQEFILVILFLLFFLFLTFCTDSLFNFYIFFECTLIPTMLLILGWGYQPERLSAGYYLLFYTLFFSLPMLLGIFYIYNNCFTLSFFLIDIGPGFYLYLSMLMGFLVKMPMIFIHFWLPKAHVEAPISGSMILAGVLLKLGGYGILRVFGFLGIFTYDYLLIGLSLYGMLMVGLLCLFQLDMKSLVAYSSVSHMGMVICGLFTFNNWGLVGSLVLMIAHGLCSSGMFCLVNIIYERSSSRILVMNKGLISFMPSLSLFWFLLCINNTSSPPSLNLLGELMLINGILSWSTFSIFFLMFSCFISCVYSLYLYSYVNHGSMFSGYGPVYGGLFIEYLLLLMHWFPINFLFLKFDIFSIFV